MAETEKQRGFLSVPGTEIRLPYTEIVGTKSGPHLVVTGGVHGGEYPGIEASIRWAASLDPALLAGRITVIHLSNPPAFYAKRQYVSPLDNKNLNRVFPGDDQGTPTERVARAIIDVVKTGDAWVDLHGGDIHEGLVPFVIFSDQGGEAVVRQAEAMARIYGIQHMLRSSAIAGGSYATAAHLGIPALLAESGQVGQVDESSVQIHLRGLTNLLVHWGMLKAPKPQALDNPILERFHWISSPATGLYYGVFKPGDWVDQGQVGGVIKNVFGDLVHEVVAPQSGVVLFTVTSLAINEGDPLFAIAAP